MAQTHILKDKESDAMGGGLDKFICTNKQRLTVTEWKALVLYQELNEFITQSERQVRSESDNCGVRQEKKFYEESCEYSIDEDSNSLVCTKRPAFFYNNVTIVFGAAENT